MAPTRVLSAVPAFLAVFVLAGCAVSPAPPVSPPTDPGVTPTPTAKPSSRSHLVIEPERFAVVDADGVEHISFAWHDDPAEIVDDLASLIGVPPVASEQIGDGSHVADFDIYEWEGMTFRIARLDDELRERYYLASELVITSASVGDLDVRSTTGIRVGDSLADALASATVYHSRSSGDQVASWIDAVDPTVPIEGYESTACLLLISAVGDDVVLKIAAPSAPQF